MQAKTSAAYEQARELSANNAILRVLMQAARPDGSLHMDNKPWAEAKHPGMLCQGQSVNDVVKAFRMANARDNRPSSLRGVRANRTGTRFEAWYGNVYLGMCDTELEAALRHDAAHGFSQKKSTHKPNFQNWRNLIDEATMDFVRKKFHADPSDTACAGHPNH